MPDINESPPLLVRFATTFKDQYYASKNELHKREYYKRIMQSSPPSKISSGAQKPLPKPYEKYKEHKVAYMAAFKKVSSAIRFFCAIERPKMDAQGGRRQTKGVEWTLKWESDSYVYEKHINRDLYTDNNTWLWEIGCVAPADCDKVFSVKRWSRMEDGCVLPDIMARIKEQVRSPKAGNASEIYKAQLEKFEKSCWPWLKTQWHNSDLGIPIFNSGKWLFNSENIFLARKWHDREPSVLHIRNLEEPRPNKPKPLPHTNSSTPGLVRRGETYRIGGIDRTAVELRLKFQCDAIQHYH